MRSTRGWESHRVSSARSTRAEVDLPTATEPATPITNGIGASSASPRKRFVDWKSRCRRSEEHTSELQSRFDLVCRLLLEKKKENGKNQIMGNNNQVYL